ncbi:MAG: D-2-hydroxyacid dehydrogenase, partial [Clostridiaceae bacterium]|nr:D-2-hydroxyacid dehydrogenase [Clostridiaceae bacterium]
AGLFGKTIGILGIGAIGSQTAAVAHAYGMKVLGLNRSGAVSSNVDKMYRTDQLHELLPQCDYVVNILPLTTETRHILAKTEFELMKDDAIYVNVGRGGTNDTSALISALENGKLAAAGLDVFEIEPLPSDDPLWQMEQVMITAHNAGMTRDYVNRVMDILTANIADYLQTGIPGHNLVDLDREY